MNLRIHRQPLNRRRNGGDKRIEMYNILTEAPVSQFSTFPVFSQSRCVSTTSKTPPVTMCLSSPEIDPAGELSDEKEITDDGFHNFSGDPTPRASSPLHFQPFVCSVLTISENSILEDVGENADSTMLYSGSDVTLKQATSLLELFSSRFALSDEASVSLYSVVQALLPRDNQLPSGHSLVKQMKKDLSNQTRAYLDSSKGVVKILNFRNQLQKVLKRNLSQIVAYSDFRLENSHLDHNSNVAPVVNLRNCSAIEMNLVLSTDGVNIKKSTYRKELWPVWLQCSDSPPILRMSRKNIILACLFVGSGAPNWHEIVPRLRAELITPIETDSPDFPRKTVVFKVRLLVADMCAKTHLLNMMQFNGFFGCHFCTAEGKTIGKTHAYYPFQQSGSIREPELNNQFIQRAKLTSVGGPSSVFGVKGRSAFSDLVIGLPLTAPVDYMHCVLLGVFPELLKLIIRKMTTSIKREVNDIVNSLACPRELISYSRKIRSLDEIGQFKANEFFNWMFYVSPVVFRKCIPGTLYESLLNLVFGVRLLLESSRENDILLSENLLNQFFSNIVDIFDGNERSETINVHSLRHLPDQVRRFGPLFAFSAMSFESANRILSEVYSGTHHECDVICRRFLQKQRLLDLHQDRKQNQFSGLVKKLLRRDDSHTTDFSTFMSETESLHFGRLTYPNAIFFNRFSKNNLYFDSPAYSRAPSSCMCNSFVRYRKTDEECFGKILYFLSIPDEPFDGKVQASVQEYEIVEEIGPVKGFFML